MLAVVILLITGCSGDNPVGAPTIDITLGGSSDPDMPHGSQIPTVPSIEAWRVFIMFRKKKSSPWNPPRK